MHKQVRYTLHVYKSDCLLQRAYKFVPIPPGGSREEIERWTYKSRRRLAFVAANTDVIFKAMITLTYPKEFPGDGKAVKRHLGNFLRYLRHNEAMVEYLWFLEFQKRGAPHVHLLLDKPESDLPDKKAISSTWYRICGSGDGKHLLAGTRTENLRSADGGTRYAVKYAMKMEQKNVPEEFRNVGRFWGHSRGVKPTQKGKLEFETFGELRQSLGTWKYKGQLENYRVSTLYNAAKELGNENIT